MSQSGAWMFDGDFIENWAFIDKAFSKEECAKIIKENPEFKDAVVDIDNKTETSIRKSKVCWIYPNENNRWLFERLTKLVTALNENFFRFDLYGIAEGIQLTKYEAPSGFYGKHIDKMYGYIPRKLSITIQLSEPTEYEGGDLMLHMQNEPIVMSKDIGRLIAFPSYVLHEVTPVTKGSRYSLVVWVSGKPFK